MTTKAMTVEDAEKQLDTARQKLNVLESRLRSGRATLEEHIAAQQFVHFADDVLKNVRERVTDEEQEAEAEAARKIAEQKRRLKAEADLPVVEKRRTTAENFVSAAIEIHHDFKSPEDNPVKVALSLVVDALDAEVHGGPDRGALDRIRQEILKPLERRKLAAIRKEEADVKEILAATNGGHTTKGSK